VILHVILPSALPEILVGMRIAIGFGWTTLVAAEMVAANVGLGQMVLNASNFLRTDIVIMGIVVIGVVAYLFDLLMRWVEKWLVPWKGRMSPAAVAAVATRHHRRRRRPPSTWCSTTKRPTAAAACGAWPSMARPPSP
jgi:hypothetical protein